MTARVFLLSPARCDGERAKLLFRDEADFPLARALRQPQGADVGEVFSFLSGLYFRGKLAYANAFARPVTRDEPGTLVITTDRGLVSPAERVRIDDLRAFACVDIAAGDERYVAPMRRDVEALARTLAASDEVVLLGSIATGKYVDVMLSILGDRLLFPSEFVGRGDMSRGGLLLRCVSDGRELAYVPVAGAIRRGSRPPRLQPLPRR